MEFEGSEKCGGGGGDVGGEVASIDSYRSSSDSVLVTPALVLSWKLFVFPIYVQ